ncbi:hypothetical protein NPIL_605001, partial [Nephila pilipes]
GEWREVDFSCEAWLSSPRTSGNPLTIPLSDFKSTDLFFLLPLSYHYVTPTLPHFQSRHAPVMISQTK